MEGENSSSNQCLTASSITRFISTEASSEPNSNNDSDTQMPAAAEEDSASLKEPEDENQIILSVCWCQEKLGAAFFDINTAQVYVVEDKPEHSPQFALLQALFRELQPRHLVVGGRQVQVFYRMLQQLCNPARTQPSSRSEDATESGNTTTDSSTGADETKCQLHFLSGADFMYAHCRQRVLSLKLPVARAVVSPDEFASLDDDGRESADGEADEAMRASLIRAVLDVNASVAATRALGGLLRLLDRRGAELLPADTILDGTPVLGLQPYVLPDTCYMDAESIAALQLLAEDEPINRVSRATAGAQDLSLLTLLARTASPLAMPLLRRVLLRPLVCRRTLEWRYDLVQWAQQPRNAATVAQLLACLKNIAHVQLILCRLQRACLSPRDWRSLYRTLFSLTLIGELCRNEGDNVHLLHQIGASATEELHRAAFLIQRVLDFEAAERDGRFVVRPGVDTQLDAKKQHFNGVGSIMQPVARLELERLPPQVESCCIFYVGHVGYLLALPEPTTLPEDLPHLKYMFSVSDFKLFKSDLTAQLDQELGDLQIEIANHESRLMLRLVQTLLSHTAALVTLLDLVLMLDVLLAFSCVAQEQRWVRPELHDAATFVMTQARHPLYELGCRDAFVPNDARSGVPLPHHDSGDDEVRNICVVTGPNGSGKTVYLKTVGVVALLAQVGSFVPAERVVMKPFHALQVVRPSLPSVTSAFSSFLLELNQLSRALREGRKHSLLLIDEFGSTTYESDGIAILLAALQELMPRQLGHDEAPPHDDSLHSHEFSFTGDAASPSMSGRDVQQDVHQATPETSAMIDTSFTTVNQRKLINSEHAISDEPEIGGQMNADETVVEKNKLLNKNNSKKISLVSAPWAASSDSDVAMPPVECELVVDEEGAVQYQGQDGPMSAALHHDAVHQNSSGNYPRMTEGTQDDATNSSDTDEPHRLRDESLSNCSPTTSSSAHRPVHAPGAGEQGGRDTTPKYADFPHVFVSTHLLNLYDYMQHQEHVCPVVLKTVLSPEGELVPLHQACVGRCVRSEAAQVARLAGLPRELVLRARQIEEQLLRGCADLTQWHELTRSDEADMCGTLVAQLLQCQLSSDAICRLLTIIEHQATLRNF